MTFDETSEDLADVGLSGGELQSLLSDGWSARVIGGVTADFQGGSQFSMGAELGGLGGDLQSWKIRAGMDLPF